MKLSLCLLVALGLGVILTYGLVRLYPLVRLSPLVRLDSQEWGVVVTTFGEGARLYGLFDSKGECLNGRTAFIEEYKAMIGELAVKKGSRAVVFKGLPNGALVMVTFSCLPLREIRGLSLVTDSGG